MEGMEAESKRIPMEKFWRKSLDLDFIPSISFFTPKMLKGFIIKSVPLQGYQMYIRIPANPRVIKSYNNSASRPLQGNNNHFLSLILYIHIYIYIYLYIYPYIYIYIYVYLYIYIFMYILIYICMYIYIYRYIDIYTYMLICMYIYAYFYT